MVPVMIETPIASHPLKHLRSEREKVTHAHGFYRGSANPLTTVSLSSADMALKS